MTLQEVEATQKIFVLDTSVIIYDHDSILEFDEHNVAIPITVLEELDEFKKGRDTKNFEAREFIRFVDAHSQNHSLRDWVQLPGEGKGYFKIIMNTEKAIIDAEEVYVGDKMDHKILNAALHLQEVEKDRKVILVTKDVNLRLKAKALNLRAEDYETGKVSDVNDILVGAERTVHVTEEEIVKLHKDKFVKPEELPSVEPVVNNGFYIMNNGVGSGLAYYNPFNKKYEKVEKKNCYGVRPRNAEQAFAVHALLNPDVKLVAIQGVAGTGKTLLALAAALEQRRNYKQIYLARPIVPLSNKDIGYLPGDIKSKLNPYMEPLWDNLKFIRHLYNEGDKEFKQLNQMVENEKLVISPLAYIRGRSFSDVIFIIDEAQNLTPHEIKTVITRAGENSKFIFTGDIQQIDTPYLDERSNGLSYLVDRLKGQDLFAHIRLEKGERSALANLANELL